MKKIFWYVLAVVLSLLASKMIVGQTPKMTFSASVDSLTFTVIHKAGMDSCQYELRRQDRLGSIDYKLFSRQFRVAHAWLSDSSLNSLCAISLVSGRTSAYSPAQTIVFKSTGTPPVIPPVIPPVNPPVTPADTTTPYLATAKDIVKTWKTKGSIFRDAEYTYVGFWGYQQETWIEKPIDFKASGEYLIAFPACSPGVNQAVRIWIDGAVVATEPCPKPTKWINHLVKVTVPAGIHTLRLGGWDLSGKFGDIKLALVWVILAKDVPTPDVPGFTISQ